MLPEPILVDWELTYFGHANPPFGIPEAEVRRPPLVRGFDDYLSLRQRGGALFLSVLSCTQRAVEYFRMTLHEPLIIKHAASKADLRVAALAYRTALCADARRHYSDQIAARLCDYLVRPYAPVSSLLLYRSMPSEVNTDKLFQLPDYRIFAPITHHHQQMEWRLTSSRTIWTTGLFGVPEPVSGSLWREGAVTVLLCPLTAFDRQGNRLGMGKGCFDYWLGSHRHALSQVIGLAFAGQEVAHIPAEAHDAPLDCIITEKEVIECPKA